MITACFVITTRNSAINNNYVETTVTPALNFNSTVAARDYGNQLENRLNSDNQVRDMFTVTSVISQG